MSEVDTNKVVDRKISFTILMEATNTNPNGDPDRQNEARKNSRGYGIITPGCTNSMIRNAALVVLPDKPIYMLQPGTIFEDNSEIYRQLNLQIKDKKARIEDGVIAKVQKAMCDKFPDICWFGGVLDATDKPEKSDNKTNGGKNWVERIAKADESEDEDEEKSALRATAGTMTGPIRIYYGQTVDPIYTTHHTITRRKKTNSKREKDTSEMGSQEVIEYGLYRINGVVTPFYAKQTGLTYGRFLEFIKCVQQMAEIRKSASKCDLRIRRIDVWAHPDELSMSFDAFETLTIKPLNNPTQRNVEIVFPSSFEDYANGINLDSKAVTKLNLKHSEVSRGKITVDILRNI